MAKAGWVILNPQSGSGNSTVDVTANVHTGRTVRSTTLTFKAANVNDVTRTVKQAGKPEFVDMEDTAASDKTGKIVTISGISNSSKLTFSLGTGDLDILLPNKYTANSATVDNGSEISGDPGATAQYDFSIAISVPSNTGITALTRQLIVEDGAGHRDTCTITLAAGDAYLNVQIGDIELDYQGNKVSISVESNTSWSIV